MNISMPRRGRPRIYETDIDRHNAAKAKRLARAASTKNITLDADLVEALNNVANKLSDQFGFRPTLSQTVRHLINKVN